VVGKNKEKTLKNIYFVVEIEDVVALNKKKFLLNKVIILALS
jgi:hypothetical protein